MHQLELDTVRLVPFREPPHRELPADPGPEVRYEMCALVAEADPRFEVSRIELERAGPSYTADTLATLHERAPEAELFLILGGDQAAALPQWRDPERVLALATVAAAARVDWPRDRVASALAGLTGADRVRFFEMPLLDVSSSMIRAHAARREPIRYLVPDNVAGYIEANDLYGASAPVGAD